MCSDILNIVEWQKKMVWISFDEYLFMLHRRQSRSQRPHWKHHVDFSPNLLINCHNERRNAFIILFLCVYFFLSSVHVAAIDSRPRTSLPFTPLTVTLHESGGGGGYTPSLAHKSRPLFNVGGSDGGCACTRTHASPGRRARELMFVDGRRGRARRVLARISEPRLPVAGVWMFHLIIKRWQASRSRATDPRQRNTGPRLH